jgi:hypothetical protein
MKFRLRSSLPVALALFGGFGLTVVACDPPAPSKSPVAPAPAAETQVVAKVAAAGVTLDGVTRADFNRVAAELALPVFWTADANKNATLEPVELAVYWGLVPGATSEDYVVKGEFTENGRRAVQSIVTAAKANLSANETSAESARREAVKKELAQGRVTLVETDLSKLSNEERQFVTSITKAAELVERLYAKQEGALELRAMVKADDLASQSLFFRNQGPRCEAPKTQADPACGAIAPLPKGKISGLYPKEWLARSNFCDELAKAGVKSPAGASANPLTDPFTVVQAEGTTLKAVPYHEAWKTDVEAIRGEIKNAAAALGAKEPALKNYLLASAEAFVSDNWWAADEAWAKMDAKNSKFYLRIGPDEVYHEPCSTKALYHVSFGLINQGSLKWQNTLDPLKNEMEHALAAMAGAPYKAREVSFKLPDFVDIALNAGDSRPPSGATIGQSLPNFGPVANEGRGRTVAMTNFYQDPDSIEALKASTQSLFCADSMTFYTDSQEPQLMSTVLHEAAHNLGPAHQYKANGKVDRVAFGGPLASTLEELKAQTAALYFTDWLAEKKTIRAEDASKAHVRDVVWAFGHISRGMYDDDKHPKNYSQLAAIQVGWLIKHGAMTFHAEKDAANSADKGCFSLSLEKFPTAIKALMIEVAQIKGTGDKARAEKLMKEFVDVAADKKKVHDVITERVLRAPKPSFVYGFKTE